MPKSSVRHLVAGLSAAAVVAVAAPLLADTPEPLKTSLQVERQIGQAAVASQRRVENLDDQTRQMLDEYLAIRTRTDRLRIYNDQVERLIRSQQEEIVSLEQQLDEVEVVEQEIVPLMLRMIDSLERFVALDVPFLPDERDRRVRNLRDLMDRSDVTISEKYRNVMEAYQIEAEYGRTMSAYRGTLAQGGDEREVDFLQVGRLVLAYQTLDRNETGFYNTVTGEWEILSDRYRNPVNQGLRMARQQAAQDILQLPVPAPERL
jgi:hypothetical protein